MKRTVLPQALFFLLGLLLGALLLFLTLTRGWLPNTRVTITTGTKTSSVSTVVSNLPQSVQEDGADLSGHDTVLLRAVEVAGYIRDGNWGALAGAVHPEKGVTFTPYSSVEPHDMCFSAEEVAAFGSDSRSYFWGYMDGSGASLTMTPQEYFARYVFNVDYTQAPLFAVDRVMSYGNAVENVADAYPDGTFAEFYYDGLDPVNEGFDWCTLKLVFEAWEGRLMLVGVIHGEWTT